MKGKEKEKGAKGTAPVLVRIFVV